MERNQASFFQQLLDQPILRRIRRNHGLEHASLHILSQRYPRVPMAGHSNPTGFWLIGNVPAEAIADAVQEALGLLRSGQHYLAIHPNCGTNYLAAGMLAGLAGAAAMFGTGTRRREQLERLPLAVTLATLALIFAQPLGLLLQERVTTSGQPGMLEVVEIQAVRRGRMSAYRITTRG